MPPTPRGPAKPSLRRRVRAATLAGVAVTVLAGMAGCGSSGGPGPAGSPAPRLALGNGLTFLLQPVEVPAGFSPTVPAYVQQTDPRTIQPAFGTEATRVSPQLATAAEADYQDQGDSAIFAHVFVFRSLAEARRAWPTFARMTRLLHPLSVPPGSAGQQGVASTEAYGTKGENESLRYAFIEHNVLSYVELDGPKGTHSLPDLLRLAAAQDAHVVANLS